MARTRVDHAALVDELHAQLADRFEQMTTSREWLDYLATARRFHRYSPQNQLLLALQGAEGYVAGYRNWQRVPAQGGGTCQVAKGSVGLKILAPLTAKVVDVDDATGEETTRSRLRGFRTVKVFHQGQLVAPPDIGDAVLPELLIGENRWQHVWSAVAGRLEDDGYSVDLHTRTPVEKWNGMTSWADKAVLVAGDLEPPQRLKTLLHEWAHVELGHDTRVELPRAVKEVEAESVAYLLAQTVGLDSDAYSVPYIANWSAGDIETVQSAAEQILTTTKRLVTTLEAELGIELTPDALDHMVPETNVIELRATADAPPVAEITSVDADQVVQELPFVEPIPPPSTTLEAVDDASFLKAVMVDLEPDQKTRLASVVYDTTRAGEAAAIIATSGRTATQTARVLDSVHFDTETIRDALLAPTDDAERPTLYPEVEVRAALHTVASPSDVEMLMPPVDEFADVARQLRDDRIDDLRLIARAVGQNDEPARIAALAYGLDISPDQTIKVCATIDAAPQRTMAIAIAMREGDGVAAFDDLTEGWPDVPGGWEQHAHPSMRATRSLAAVPDYNPTRAILDQWAGRSTAPEGTSPEPALP
ncbi:ArdC family protein [Ilumatobacter sp.]|uniref:ArdC family protein n=1 Tax=Ilumatobacter sp. TaxID=1967498 RepID=UPI003B521FFE